VIVIASPSLAEPGEGGLQDTVGRDVGEDGHGGRWVIIEPIYA
jgi:hypothetical protein